VINILVYEQGGGPSWLIPLGRKDSLTANQTLANQNLPAPFFTLDQLKASFLVQGLNTTDLVTLSGIKYNQFHTYQQFNKKSFTHDIKSYIMMSQFTIH